jgi:hypothetical protein
VINALVGFVRRQAQHAMLAIQHMPVWKPGAAQRSVLGIAAEQLVPATGFAALEYTICRGLRRICAWWEHVTCAWMKQSTVLPLNKHGASMRGQPGRCRYIAYSAPWSRCRQRHKHGGGHRQTGELGGQPHAGKRGRS